MRKAKIPACLDLIQQSFLNEDGKKFYGELLSTRLKRLLKK
jgi:hypothetical protein